MARASGAAAGSDSAIALLRGVNVGGHAVLRMAQLQALLLELGYLAPRTLLQSGNVVFGVKAGPRRETPAQIEARLERELSSRLSIVSDVLVRTAAEWDAVIDANPFPDAATADPSHLIVMALKDVPAGADVTSLAASIKGREVVRAHGRELYIVYPDGMGTSKFTGAVIERVLGTRGTARNWNTVLKLAALAAAMPHTV